MVAPSRPSAARCRCSTPTSSPALEHLAIDPDLDGRVRDAIESEMSRQNSNGAFGLWAADDDGDDLWLDAFVTDFLTRARERGFAVPAQGFDSALDHLRNAALNVADPGEGAGEPLAYALYVLARNGRPIIGDLRYLADTKLAVVQDADGARRRSAPRWRCSATARAPARSSRAALDALEAEKDNGLSRPDYGSRLRDGAAVLALLAEANLTNGEIAGDPIARAGAVVDAGARRAQLHQHAGEQLARARRRGARRASDAEPDQRRRPAGRRRALSQMARPTRSAKTLATSPMPGQSAARVVTTISGVPLDARARGVAGL